MSVLPAMSVLENGQPDPSDLRQLVQTVMETSERLEATHVALHNQVSNLQQELAEANAKLRRSRALAALGEMAAGIAHEIRNPLGSIQLYTNMLAEDLEAEQEQSALCGKIASAVQIMDGIVRDVLLFSRDVRMEKHETDAEDVIRRSLTCCDSLIHNGSIRIDMEDVVPRRLVGDINLLTQAFGNIIRNAVEAMRGAGVKEPRLVFRTQESIVRQVDGRRSPYTVIVVEDDGPGISPDVVERMFNPFFTTRSTGTGLGLAIVHRIIDAHGGQINVRNHSGGGARFEVCLPQEHVDVSRSFEVSADIEITREARAGIDPGFGHGRPGSMEPATEQEHEPTLMEVQS